MKTEAQHVSNLAMLVGRLVHQIRRFDKNNDVAEKAIGYLQRSDLMPSITRGVTLNVMPETCQSCGGYGHFTEDGGPSIDKRDRMCLDCRGTGKTT